MADLVVTNLEDELVQRLEAQAMKNGRSAEAEHLEILRRALSSGLNKSQPKRSFRDFLLSIPADEDHTDS
jgi:plasmid stability protein